METPENCVILKVSGIKEASGIAHGILVHAVAQLPLAEIPYTVATMGYLHLRLKFLVDKESTKARYPNPVLLST